MPANAIFPLVKAIHRQPLVLGPDTPLPLVLETMKQQGQNYALVVDDQQRPVGLFTERQLVRLTTEKQPLQQLTLAQAIEPNPVTLAETQLDNVLTVLTQMRQARVRHLPIVSPQGQLTGIVTYTTIRQLLKPIDLLRLRRVEEVMVQRVICGSPLSTGLQLIQQLCHHQVSCIVITETGATGTPPLGIVTEHDILRLQRQGAFPDAFDWSAEQMMAAPVQTVYPQTALWQAHQQMQRFGVRRLAVVDANHALIGLITPTSLLQGLDLLETHMTIDTLREIVAERTVDLSQTNEVLQRKVEERKRAKAALQYQIARERLVSRIAHRIRQSLCLEEILHTTVTEVREFLQAERAFIYQFHQSSGYLAVECNSDRCTRLTDIEQINTILQQLRPEFYQKGRLHSIPDLQTAKLLSEDLKLFRQLPMRSLVVAPIATKQHLWGLLVVNQCSGPRRWQKLEIDLLKQLATQVGIAIQQAELYAQLETANARLEHLANADGLTQVANRRCFDSTLMKEWRRATREQQPLALIMLDIDYFKGFNDTYGHQAGDECLRAVAQVMQVALRRPADLAARYGGEEFAVILPNTPQSGAITVAQAIQANVRALAIAHGPSPVSDYVTLSLGIAVAIPKPHQSPEQLLQQADQALYTAKETGRDRYVVAPPA
jgi:diguanylate cyclase (GGDEF)-like protein